MYRSKHDPYTPPVGTTFGLQGTARLVGSTGNCLKNSAKSFGSKMGSSAASTDQFLKSTRRGPVPRSSTKFEYAVRGKKASVPRKSEVPIMGLKTSKNFVVANAVENILAGASGARMSASLFLSSAPPLLRSPPVSHPTLLLALSLSLSLAVPRQSSSTEVRYTAKRDYGKVPEYLELVKRDIQEEQEILAEYFQDDVPEEQAQSGTIMGDAERESLVRDLKKQWGVMNSRFQLISHNTMLDSVGKVRRKTELEKALDQLSADIKLLSSGRPVEVVP